MTTRPKTAHMPPPHYYRAGSDGITCAFCPLPRRNETHDPAKVAEYQQRLATRQHEHTRRYEPEEDS